MTEGQLRELVDLGLDSGGEMRARVDRGDKNFELTLGICGRSGREILFDGGLGRAPARPAAGRRGIGGVIWRVSSVAGLLRGAGGRIRRSPGVRGPPGGRGVGPLGR